MEDPPTNCAAFDETVVFLSHFKDLKDPRQQGKVTYPLDEILLLCLLAVLAGAESVVDIALFGCKKRELPRRFWILLTPLKSPTDIISVPPKFIFKPTIGNYAALALGNHAGEYASSRPDFPLFFLNSVIISIGAVALSLVASIPAAYALARFTFPLKNALGFVFMSFRFVPFLAFVIPLYLIYQQVGLYNTPYRADPLLPAHHPAVHDLDVAQLLHGNTVGNPGSRTDRRLFVAGYSHPGDPAAEHAGDRGHGHPGFHVLLERVQLSADARGARDVPRDGRGDPVHLL
jgi:hypothetical protein